MKAGAVAVAATEARMEQPTQGPREVQEETATVEQAVALEEHPVI